MASPLISAGAIALTAALSGTGIAQAAGTHLLSGMHKQPGGRAPHGIVFRADAGLASLLKMSPADLEAAFKSGKKLDEIAKAQGVTQDQLKAYFEAQRADMAAKMKTKLDAEVTSGKITQAQEDAMLAHKPGAFGPGMRGGRGRFHAKTAVTK